MIIVGMGCAGIILYNLNFFSKRDLTPKESQSQEMTKGNSDNEDIFKISFFPPIAQDRGKWKRDPFRYDAKGEETQLKKREKELPREELTVKAIVVGQGKRYALINNHIVEVGDTVGEGRVKAIQRHSIMIKEGKDTRGIGIVENFSEEEE
jgi:hypothetical protein